MSNVQIKMLQAKLGREVPRDYSETVHGAVVALTIKRAQESK